MANRGSLWMGRTYSFVDKDPEIDRMRTLYQKQRIKESDLAVVAGLAGATVKNMFGGKTRRPQFVTYAKLAGAMGKKYDLVDEREVDYASEIPKAKEEFKLHKLELAKKKKGAVKKRKNGK